MQSEGRCGRDTGHMKERRRPEIDKSKAGRHKKNAGRSKGKPSRFRTKHGLEAILLGLGAAVVSLLIMLFLRPEDTLRDGYLPKSEYGSRTYREALDVRYQGGSKAVSVEIKPKVYRDEEVERFLDEVEKNLKMWITEGTDSRHVDKDLPLTDHYGDYPVDVNWLSFDPAVMTYEGKISGDVPDKGAPVHLEATLSCQDRERTVAIELMVFPKPMSEDEAFQKAIDKAVADKQTEDKIILPTEINGEAVTWHRRSETSILICLVLGVTVGLLYWYSGKQRGEDAEKKRREALMKDYPALVNKLILLLSAGIAMRRVFSLIADDYERELTDSGRERPGFGLIAEACGDMEKGISESEAYFNIGQKSGLSSYRTLSVLLLQNQKRGSEELLAIFQREAETAFEERRREARMAGEKASSQLIFPMMIMLGIIFLIIMVPAYLAF